MKNTGETKNEMILRELRNVKKKQEGKTYRTFEINIGAMASDCIDVIEDLNNEIRILRENLAMSNFAVDKLFVNMNEPDTISDIIADMIVNGASRDEITLAIEHSKVVLDAEKLREQLRGDICE